MLRNEEDLIPLDCDSGFTLDYEAILIANDVKVYSRVDNRKKPTLWSRNWEKYHTYWSLSWKHGSIGIWYCSEAIAREAAALFVYLWIKGVVAPIASRLVEAWVTKRSLETE